MNIDIIIVLAFLIVTMVVGLGHGKNVKNIKDYALGGRNFSTGALVATIVATWSSSGDFFVTISKIYSDGLYYMFATMGLGISFIILSLFIIPRMGEFLGATSIAESMGNLYGNKVRVLTAIAGTIGSAGVIAIQFKVFGNVIANFLDIEAFIAIISAGMIATTYSAFGGIRAVTFTDILQFFTFGFIVPLLGFIIWNQFYHGGFSVSQALLDPKFNTDILFDTSNQKFLGFLVMLIYFIIPTSSAPAFQRIAIGKDIAQVKKAFLIAGVILIILKISLSWIPFLMHSIDPSIPSDKLLYHIVDTYSFTGLKGLVIVAIIAFAMSTADSRINAVSVLFTNDIYKIAFPQLQKEILISRIFAAFIGLGAISLALIETDLLEIIVLANSFYYPLVTPIFLVTVFGFRSSSKSVLIGMVAGLVTTIVWKMLSINFANVSAKMIGVFVAMICNTACLFLSHYLLKQPGGWVGIKDKSTFEKDKNTTIEGYNKFFSSVKNFNFKQFTRNTAPKNEITYTMVGIYFIIYTIITMYSGYSGAFIKQHYNVTITILGSMLVTGTMMSMYPLWPQSIDRQIKESIIQAWWPLTIFYMLILFSSFFVMVNGFNTLQIAIFSINMILAALLFSWRISVILIPLGFYSGVLLYQFSFDTNVNLGLGSPESILLYVIMLAAASVVIFLKPKQEYLEATEAKVDTLKSEITHLDHELADLSGKVVHYSQRVSDHEKEIERLGATAQRILNNVNHELRLPIGNVVNFSDMLHETLQKSDDKLLQQMSEEVLKNSTRVSTMILNMLDLATLEVKKIDLQKKTINFGELVEDRVKGCRKIYLQGKKIDFELSIQPEVMIAVDPNFIRQVVDNIVINAISYSEEGLIKINVCKVKNKIELNIEDQGIGIPKNEIYDIFDPFKMGSKTESKAEGRGIGLALCKSVIEAHDGKITAESDGKRGAKFSIILPIKRA